MAGVPVSFTSTSGGLAITQGITDNNGQAIATLSTAGDSSPRTITVTASAGGRTATTGVTVAATSSSTTVNIGNGSGTAFQPNVLAIAVPTLSAGGSTSVTVSVVRQDGTLYSSPVSLNFNSPCVAAGTAQIQPSATVTTTTGQATVTYVARGCSGSDTITATTTVGSQSLSATGSVTVAAAAIGTIAFVSATPTNIALKGTGDPSRPEASTVVFKVLDAAGGARAGANVTFALNTSVGGISLTPATATAVSDAQGLVQIVVNAGTVSTSVKVTASVTSVTPSISTQSSQLTVTTGIPTAASFSLALACANVEGLDLDGTTTAVTARLADRFGNPVPDGTAVTVTAEGGAVQAQCTTTTSATESGFCSVNWRSSNPRPPLGRVTLLAKAIGEESFSDANGNGAFDNGENFADLAEPFRDDDESGTYVPGTDADFFDFNNNGARDAADGKFNGVLCNDTSGRCGGPTTRSTGIGVQNIIVMSGSTPNVTQVSGAPLAPIAIALSGSASVTVWVRDGNDNIMPGGTVVSASFSGPAATLGQPSAFSVPCSNMPTGTKGSGTVFSFSLTGQRHRGTGNLQSLCEDPERSRYADPDTGHRFLIARPMKPAAAAFGRPYALPACWASATST